MGLLRSVALHAIGTAYNLPIHIADRAAIARGRHLEIVRQFGDAGRITAPNIAIVALHPSAESIPFTLNLFRALREAEFFILAFSTGPLGKFSIDLVGKCDCLIERRPVGRDFGSYQMGLSIIADRADMSRIERLVLANDSMFYPQSFGGTVKRMTARHSGWSCLFENFEHHYHAQSFFQMFGPAVFQSEAFKKFWRKYIPFSSRTRAINRGEVGLSRALGKAAFFPDAEYSGARIVDDAIKSLHSTDNLDDTAAGLATMLGESWPRLLQRYRITTLGSKRNQGAFLADLAAEMSRRIERHNPTHCAALLSHHLFAAPIKRDLAYRDIFSIGTVMQQLRHYDDKEIAAIARDLRIKGNVSSIGCLRRLLHSAGCI
ncbi:MAG TPA: rhamnan synthesis F family protein [Xanthobacteraceae bacterium]